MTSIATGRAFLDDPGGAGDHRQVIAMAHRGGAGHPDLFGLENTMAAFGHAAALGYRYLETDVHVTADGELVAFHDAVLDRVTDRSGVVARLPLTQVREARVDGREPIPTLAELVETLPGVRLNIDVKSVGAVEALAAFVIGRGLEDDVLVGSFSRARLRAFRRAVGGRVATSACPPEAALFWATGRRVGGWDALQLPPGRGRLAVTTTRLLRHAHACGAPVHVWTVDDPTEMNRLLDLGVDGLMTDRTDLLKGVLVERGAWSGVR